MIITCAIPGTYELPRDDANAVYLYKDCVRIMHSDQCTSYLMAPHPSDYGHSEEAEAPAAANSCDCSGGATKFLLVVDSSSDMTCNDDLPGLVVWLKRWESS
jgi:hypothetical protein